MKKKLDKYSKPSREDLEIELIVDDSLVCETLMHRRQF